MDDDGLNMRNWGYYETPSYKAQLNLQLMTNMADRDTKHFLPGRDPNIMVGNHGAFHPRDCMVTDASIPMNYMREGWMGQREKFLNMLPVSPHYPMLPETSGAHSLHILQPPNSSRDERVPRIDERVPRIDEKPARVDDRPAEIEESSGNKGVQSKKRQGGGASKIPKPKKARKPKENGGNAAPRVKPAKKSLDVFINGIDMDISGIPIPVCSCTGAPQQCYRWGCGGWQSACCTTNVSVYPLPMSTKRRGARIAGRKMSQGAFKKVLEKLVAEGYNFGNPIDLRTHWARHGTNKFVTIR
ncbi:protein BASIC PENTACYSTEINE1-like [Tripterygium wilfordii]|uniref:protein BASIC PENTACYSTEINE1-like n=1 Tax=Tripterygium wilfordii TaxID=458696 RepID=UPI0018F7FF66|nr:protein BASIC PENTACYSTEINE1-like [Tripterygium wilfordii]XP_038697304.1 protein BASIC PENTACYSTEINE1-like [Tripterygium wilfordii]